MASVSAPPFPSRSPYKKSNPRKPHLRNPKILSSTSRQPLKIFSPALSHRASDSFHCRCGNQSSPLGDDSNVDGGGWTAQFQVMAKRVITGIEDYLNSPSSKKSDGEENVELEVENMKLKENVNVESEDWDWERWMKHFAEIEEQENIVSVLKSQLGNAVRREEYEYASKIKVAMAAAATNDVVGRVITHLKRAIEEERYQDASFFRDYAGAGLMGWWAGILEDSDDPYGRIIHIGVEYGRYVARSFSPRHLAAGSRGAPLFEVFLTIGSKGEYRQQAVYLKRDSDKFDNLTSSPKLIDPSSNLSKLKDSSDGKNERSPTSTGNIEDTDDESDVVEGVAGFQNILQDMIPGEVTIFEVSEPDKGAKDLISSVIGQIIEEEEEEDDSDDDDDGDDDDDDDDDDDEGKQDATIESMDIEEDDDGDDDSDDDIKVENHQDEDGIETDAGHGDSVKDNGKERTEMTIKIVFDGRLQKLSSKGHAKTLLRVPATLKKKDRLSFSFSIEEDDKKLEIDGKEHGSPDKGLKLQGPHSISNVMSNLAKFAMNREKIPTKVLKDVEELISLTLNQAKNRQPLSGTLTFNRIEIPASSDLLNGLYIGAHGLYTSEVIHLSRKFGQWQEDGVTQKRSNLEFYEYVEALKLTGDPRVPAGQVAFRAKVGKQYQLPHKGIIPEEFGVVARYKGQGRLADPGFKNPRWVDGELVILNGKHIKGGPVVGFVYWAPGYHFLVFFNRLRLPE